MPPQTIKEAQFWEKLDGDVSCHLCHQECRIRPGKRGLCSVRENQDGKLMSLVYGSLVAANADPIEKKPLFHFLPGSFSYSIATAGCNFRCLHCQNSEISQLPRETGRIPGQFVSPQQVVEQALSLGCSSISCTYTEPTVFLEYALDVAAAARQSGLKNVFVSNGYMSERAVQKIAPLLDAINIDLKGDDQFYRKVCSAQLEPVRQNIELFWKMGVWVEVTTLLIPGYNDSDPVLEEIARFLASISPDLPWHVSAFYPMYRMKDVPRTDTESLRRGLSAGRRAGIKHVYAGNIPGESENTLCPSCGELLIERIGYRIMRNSLREGCCPHCRTALAGVWS
ncbi:MAG TPA: AmmeMemoRadiSam system radical SAM enzyme [Methanothrix sp.]|nr:AmmeMemoRadiSam system radical SAM enzyme [Methanothrix sp.]HPT18591.1 AmmeMemoRadiSam system radical SAM enzyme [Methanothrix sp.]